jgi:RNA polymerase sigma-70 factor (ECF subfamily)
VSDSEADVLALLDRGDTAGAATAAIRGYGPQVFGYLTAILKDDDVAADAFSAFCEDLWRGIGAFRRESSVRTWAYRVAWHAAMRAAREPWRKKRQRLATSAASDIAAEVRSTTLTHLKQSTADRLAEARRSLTAEEQTLLILRVDRNLPWKDVAHVLSTELRKRFERLKEKLRDKLR